MKISKPEVLEKNNVIEFRIRVESSEGDETLWYNLSGKFSDLVTDLCDAPLVALLIPAMAKGEDIYISGMISERLYYNLSGPYQRLLQYVIPSLHLINLYPSEIQSGGQRASGVATGFSAGIDSYCVLADHFYSDIPVGFKITHLLFNNVGSHGKGGERLFRERYSSIEPVVERIGLPLIKVNSNLSIFYGKGLDFQQTHTPRNASVALLLQRGIGRYMYASSYNYIDAFVGDTYDMAYSDSIALPLISTERLDIFSVSSEYTRVNKTLRMADVVTDSYTSIDVCVGLRSNNIRNCSLCWKCMRTLLTLDIAGIIDCYSTSFDIDAYKRGRKKYIASVIISHDPLLKEIVKFAQQKRYSFPFYSYIYAFLIYIVSQLKRVVRLPIRVARELKGVLKGSN